MMKLSLKQRILIPIIIIVLIGFLSQGYAVAHMFRSEGLAMQNKYVEQYAKQNLVSMTSMLEVPLDEARSLATAFGEFQKENALDRDNVTKMLEEWLGDNEEYLGVYTAWEPNAFDGNDNDYKNTEYHDTTGRFIPYIFKNGDSVSIEALADYDTLDYYQKPKETKREIITDPYEYEAGGEMFYLVSVVVPIIVDDQFMGIVGVDISMNQLQGLVDNAELFDTGYFAVLSSNGTLVAHKSKDIIGEDVKNYFDNETGEQIDHAITEGTSFITEYLSTDTGKSSYIILLSEQVGLTGTNWAVLASVPMAEKNAFAVRIIAIGVSVGMGFYILIIIILTALISKSVVNPLKQSIDQIQKSSDQVSDSSNNLSSSSQQLAEGSNEQAASIEETSATMDETSSMIKQNAENTKQANKLSEEASQSATEGSTMMKDMNDTMDEIKESSDEISKIIKVIDDIAFQTNMLALNAAVEAARAGDAGLGFAVVAEEVRNLAQKSAAAAKDTADIIEKNIELSKYGVEISDNVGYMLDDILEKTKNVNQIITEIADASEEQAKGTYQVTQAIAQMENVVQSNAASAEETAASSEQMNAQAEGLAEIVFKLSQLVNGVKNEQENQVSNEENIKSESTEKMTMQSSKVLDSSTNQLTSPGEIIPLDDESEF